jgi:hypothetical protein
MKASKVLWIFIAIVVILVCVILLLISEAQFPNVPISSGMVAIISAVLGVLLTVAVTSVLLNKQDELQRKKEIEVKVFEKKQAIYHAFLSKLQDIIQDGEIKIGKKSADGNIDMKVDELKDLIFQLGYLQMHSKDTVYNKILKEVAEIIQNMNEFSSTKEHEKQKALPDFYAKLFMGISEIVVTLKKDLYQQSEGSGKTEEKRKEIEDILRECGLFVVTGDFNKYELQNYFWDELQKQLIEEKGYKIEQKNFRQDVNEYYARARNRHRWFGIEFPVLTKQNGEIIKFRVEIGNNYFYGFRRPKYRQEDAELVKTIKQVSDNFKETDWWYGQKSSDRFDLDFWNLRSPAFEQLKHHSDQKKLLKEIVDEIDMYIKKFVEVAKSHNL